MNKLNTLIHAQKALYQNLVHIVQTIRIDMESEFQKKQIQCYRSCGRQVHLCFYNLNHNIRCRLSQLFINTTVKRLSM